MSKNKRGNVTKVAPANKMGTSVKTSIPAYLVAKYKISVGDELEWTDEGNCLRFKKMNAKVKDRV
jgi:hypothetical protein